MDVVGISVGAFATVMVIVFIIVVIVVVMLAVLGRRSQKSLSKCHLHRSVATDYVLFLQIIQSTSSQWGTTPFTCHLTLLMMIPALEEVA